MAVRIGEFLASDSEPLRPVPTIEQIYHLLSPWHEPFVLNERKMPNDSIDYIYFIREGVYTIFRRTDRFPLFTSQASESRMAIYGLVDAVLDEKIYQIYPETQCKGFRVQSRHLKQFGEHSELWVNISRLVAWFSLYATRRDALINGSLNHYRIIRYHLILLMAIPAETRRTINAQRFITERTRISKSSVLRILYTLEKASVY
ncbi:MAG: helix-turn-helix domain-containing protein [Scandinavium sp.]|uniref:helix-turn-helix domain-containing protein n=1 Tax=Scandinavium sp. TaxID=2830653 RepID=UPI003F30982D